MPLLWVIRIARELRMDWMFSNEACEIGVWKKRRCRLHSTVSFFNSLHRRVSHGDARFGYPPAPVTDLILPIPLQAAEKSINIGRGRIMDCSLNLYKLIMEDSRSV